MRFYLVAVSTTGYHCRPGFSAETLMEAARVHIDAYRANRTSSPLVLRCDDGKRYSVADSLNRLRG